MDHDGLDPVLDPEMQQELGLVDARDDGCPFGGWALGRACHDYERRPSARFETAS